MQREVAVIRSGLSRTDHYDAMVPDNAEQNVPLLTQYPTDV